MPWLEERTLTLFVRDTEVRRYEPGVRERGVDVERPGSPLMGSTDPDTDPDRTLPLKASIIHGHLIGQHLLSEAPSTFFYTFTRRSASTLTIQRTQFNPRIIHCPLLAKKCICVFLSVTYLSTKSNVFSRSSSSLTYPLGSVTLAITESHARKNERGLVGRSNENEKDEEGSRRRSGATRHVRRAASRSAEYSNRARCATRARPDKVPESVLPLRE